MGNIVKNSVKTFNKGFFLIMLIVNFLFLDYFIANQFPKHITSDNFFLNDFEITQLKHPYPKWDKVFFGNSTVIAAYREELSSSGYINLGLDYGVVTDLWEIIEQEHVTIGSEIVIGLNWLTLYDNFATNPSYIWHREVYEPYTYFNRERLTSFIERIARQQFLNQRILPLYSSQTKHTYSGTLSQDELDKKVESYSTTYFNLVPSDFEKNLQALDKILKYGKNNDISIRIVWMPWNPSVEKPPIINEVKSMVDGVCADYSVEILDLMDSFSKESFYDVGHLNNEYGVYQFMEVIEKWLN